MKSPFAALRRRFTRKEDATPTKDEDGRDQWGSRTSYVLASMGGAVGFGNLLRFPSQVFNNNGIQWFIPYFLSLAFVAIPALILEVALGASYHGGPVISYNAIGKRVRGAALGNLWVSALVVFYYVPMLAYIMRFFRGSFLSPLPWEGRLDEFWNDDVLRQVEPVPATYQEALDQNVFMLYPGSSLIGEQVGWTAFSWFVVWICICNGVAVTGKVVYVTMALPIVMIVALLVRSSTLPNAVDGIRLYAGVFNADQLARGQVWQQALGQIFYSTGVGFGYYTSYASYNAKNANAAADAIIIACSNSFLEIMAGFAVFGIVGFLGLTPQDVGPIGSFTLGFITIPEGLAQMPGAQVWSVLFWLTLFLLGSSSAFVLLDVLVTTTCDTDWGRKIPRIYITSAFSIGGFLISLMYNTEFGYHLLDGIDVNTNNLVLPAAVFAECYGATVVYRCIDVIGQVGIPAFAIHQLGFVGALFVGLLVAHQIDVNIGLAVGFGMFVIGVVTSVLIARSPDSEPPGFWSKNKFLARFWWLAIYSGHQLQHDLNITLATGKNWKLPWIWHFCLRYISCPAVAIIFSFGYPVFNERRFDPMHVFGFAVSHLALLCIVSTLLLPRWVDSLVPAERRNKGERSYAPQVTLGSEDVRVSTGVELGLESDSLEGGKVEKRERVESGA